MTTMPSLATRHRNNGFTFPSEWRRSYFIRQKAKYKDEDSSHVEALEKLNSSEDIFSQFFLYNVGDSERGARRTERLRAFWGGANLDALRHGDKGPGTKLVALLDERSRSESGEISSGGDCRPWEGPLTATKLYGELRKKVGSSFLLRVLTFHPRISLTGV